MGTTVATNALLERKGSAWRWRSRGASGMRCASATRRGRQIFARHIVLRTMLYDRVEVDERVSVDGEVLVPLDEAAAREGAEGRRRPGSIALAIVLMHGWRHSWRMRRDWRRSRASWIRAALGQPRGRAADQADRPRRYHGGRCLSLAGPAPLCRPRRRRATWTRQTSTSCNRTAAWPRRLVVPGKDAILSGPAGGVVGMVAGERAARRRTGSSASTWAARRPTSRTMRGSSSSPTRASSRAFEIRAPMMQIEHRRGGRRVDLPVRRNALPRRAGKRRREARTRLLSQRRPVDRHRLQPLSGPDRPGAISRRLRAGGRPAARSRRFARAAAGGGRPAGRNKSLEADRGRASSTSRSTTWPRRSARISIARGHDVTRYTLACFGGAGGQHACRVADALGMERILDPSARGRAVGLRDRHRRREGDSRCEPVLKPLGEDFSEALSELEGRARDALTEQGIDPNEDRAVPPREAAHGGKRHDAGDRGRASRSECARTSRSFTASASVISTKTPR